MDTLVVAVELALDVAVELALDVALEATVLVALVVLLVVAVDDATRRVCGASARVSNSIGRPTPRARDRADLARPAWAALYCC